MTPKMYVAEYYKNDGGWHGAGISRIPSYLFTAKDERTAVQLAEGYITQNRGYSRNEERIVRYEEFDLTRLLKLNVAKKGPITHISFHTLKIKKREIQPGRNVDLEKQLSEAQFREFSLDNLIGGD